MYQPVRFRFKREAVSLATVLVTPGPLYTVDG